MVAYVDLGDQLRIKRAFIAVIKLRTGLTIMKTPTN